MNWLTLYGLVAVSAMLLFYALEDRSAWFVLAFAGACLLASSYGFLQGRMAVWGRGGRLVGHRRAPLVGQAKDSPALASPSP